MKSKLEELFERARTDKFKMSALDWEPARCDRDLLPTTLDGIKSDEQAHHRKQMEDYKARFGINALQVEGLARRDDYQSLADRTIDDDRQRAAGMKLATAKILYRGVPTRLWVEVTRFPMQRGNRGLDS